MTVIVVTKEQIAFDSMISYGDHCHFIPWIKVIECGKDNQPFYCGGSGHYEDIVAFQNWAENGGTYPEFEKDNFEGFIYHPGQDFAEVYGTKDIPMTWPLPYIGGSGSAGAMAAIYLKKNAKKAVEVACKVHTLSCGGEICVYNLS